MGAAVEVLLLAGDDALPIELRLPHHEVADLAPGSRVALRVDGGVVLYPAEVPGVPVTQAGALTPGA
jgi:iron(III) transport system ATP-binding protein